MEAYVDNKSGMNIKQDFEVNLPKPKGSLSVQKVKSSNYQTSKSKFYERPGSLSNLRKTNYVN